MRTLLLAAAVLAATAVPGSAQEKPKPREMVRRIIQIKYADPKAIYNLLGTFGCPMNVNESLRVISLQCYEDVMPAIEDAVKRFDVPPAGPSDIELVAYFLVASDKPEPDGVPVPAELDSVVKQIRSVLAFRNLYLFDTLALRTGGGQAAEVTGQVDNPTFSPPTLTRLFIRGWSARPGDKGDVISLQDLRAGLRHPVKKDQGSAYIDTGVDVNRVEVPLGQKVVLGKSGLARASKALIIVLSAKVP